MKNHKNITKTLRSLLAIVVAASIMTTPIAAWSQPVHMAINDQAVKRFKTVFADYDKYKVAPINFEEKYESVGIPDNKETRKAQKANKDHDKKAENYNFAWTYEADIQTNSLRQWIVSGGDWADIPAAYSGLRHFYNPLARSDNNYITYLTDQSAFFSLYDQPKTDAMTWGLTHIDNPFNWKNALKYYKKAMEIPEDGATPDAFSETQFKLKTKKWWKFWQSDIPKDRKKERELYLGLAYRGLGETMHLLADMTQPAHVRNDAHLKEEPLEDTMTPEFVKAYAKKFETGTAVDGRIADQFLSTNGTTLNNPEQLFITLSTFTNKHFYSSDTIYDEESGVYPNNGEIPIPNPQFKDLIPGEMEVPISQWQVDRTKTQLGEHPLIASEVDLLPLTTDTNIGTSIYSDFAFRTKKVKFLGASFLGGFVPMVQEKVSGRIFKSKTYSIPADIHFTCYQGRVLIPIAIAACSDLMHQFYPTLEFETEYEEPELITEKTNDKLPKIRYEVNQEAVMNHKVEDDQAWLEAGLSISYTGAGELIFENEGEPRNKIPLSFENGKLVGMQNADKEWVKEKPVLHMRQDNSVKLTKEQRYTEIKEKDSVYIQINAGGRTWTGAKLHYNFPVETLEAEYTELGLREEENYPGFGVREFAASCEAVNFETKDTKDDCYLAPLYTGKAELVFEDEKGLIKKRDVFFEDGILSKITDTEGELVDEPLILYADETAEYELTDMEKRYEIKHNQKVYFRISYDRYKDIKSKSWSYVNEFEEIDGVYVGSMTVGATQKLRDFVVTMFTHFIRPFANALAKMFDAPPLSFEELRAIVDDSTTTNITTVNIALIIISDSGNKVDVELYWYDEYGEETMIPCKGTYKNGLLRFKGTHPDASVIELTGRLYKNSRLYGKVGGRAWGIIGQAIDGEWEAEKTD